MRRVLLAPAAALAALTLLVACEPTVAPGSPFTSYVLTADGDDTYGLYGRTGDATVHASPTNAGGNYRMGWTLSSEPATTDQSVCATWVASSHEFAQQGALMRWSGTTGISATKNVWMNGFSTLNVHTWDTTAAEPFTMIASSPMPGLTNPDGSIKPLPWRLCASVTGQTVTLKVWPTAQLEPADGDPCCTRAVTDTRIGAVPAGRPGWYAGHLQPGHLVAYADLTATATATATAGGAN